jgi:hypothetical protein
VVELITGLAQALLDCATERLIADGRPVCQACIVASQETPPADGCDCKCDGGQGRAWIRVNQVEFNNHTGNVSTSGELSKCPTGAWNVHFELGVWRCIKDQLNGKCVDMLADAVAMHKDLASLIIAVQCCPMLATLRWAPEQARPIGPSGGCVAAVYEFTVQMNHLVGP